MPATSTIIFKVTHMTTTTKETSSTKSPLNRASFTYVTLEVLRFHNTPKFLCVSFLFLVSQDKSLIFLCVFILGYFFVAYIFGCIYIYRIFSIIFLGWIDVFVCDMVFFRCSSLHPKNPINICVGVQHVCLWALVWWCTYYTYEMIFFHSEISYVGQCFG